MPQSESLDAASRLNPSDPISAYYAFHLAEKNGNDTAAQRARLTMAAAYQRVLGEGGAAKAKSSAFPIVSGADSDLPLAFPPALYARGYARLARGEHADAIAEFRTAASTDPLVVDSAARSSTMQQAASLLRRGHLAEALRSSRAPAHGASRQKRAAFWASPTGRPVNMTRASSSSRVPFATTKRTSGRVWLWLEC